MRHRFTDEHGREYEVARINFARYHDLRDVGFDLARWASEALARIVRPDTTTGNAESQRFDYEEFVRVLADGAVFRDRKTAEALLTVLCRDSLAKHGVTANEVFESLYGRSIWDAEVAFISRILDFFEGHPIMREILGAALKLLLSKVEQASVPTSILTSGISPAISA
jgi:hypothetical protein